MPPHPHPHDDGWILWLVVQVSIHPAILHPSVSIFVSDDNLSKYQWIFTRLGMCIDIVELCFRFANGQISSIFDSYLTTSRGYYRFTLFFFCPFERQSYYVMSLHPSVHPSVNFSFPDNSSYTTAYIRSSWNFTSIVEHDVEQRILFSRLQSTKY